MKGKQVPNSFLQFNYINYNYSQLKIKGKVLNRKLTLEWKLTHNLVNTGSGASLMVGFYSDDSKRAFSLLFCSSGYLTYLLFADKQNRFGKFEFKAVRISNLGAKTFNLGRTESPFSFPTIKFCKKLFNFWQSSRKLGIS